MKITNHKKQSLKFTDNIITKQIRILFKRAWVAQAYIGYDFLTFRSFYEKDYYRFLTNHIHKRTFYS